MGVLKVQYTSSSFGQVLETVLALKPDLHWDEEKTDMSVSFTQPQAT